jgi:hypothetical protein
MHRGSNGGASNNQGKGLAVPGNIPKPNQGISPKKHGSGEKAMAEEKENLSCL